jgi:hypothetical protein
MEGSQPVITRSILKESHHAATPLTDRVMRMGAVSVYPQPYPDKDMVSRIWAGLKPVRMCPDLCVTSLFADEVVAPSGAGGLRLR